MRLDRHGGRARRVGIVGAGSIVEDAHLPVLLAMDDVRIAWVSDLDRSRMDLLSKMYSVRSLTSDQVGRAIEDCDVCLLAIPAGARERYLDLCAQRGVAVLCEKPFARDLTEHHERARPFAPERIAICMQRRYLHTTRVMGRLVQDQRFGPLRAVSLSMGAYDLKSGGPDRYLTNAKMAGGGILIEYGIHGLDQLVSSLAVHTTRVLDTRSLVREAIDYHLTFESLADTAAGAVPISVEMSRLSPLRQGFWLTFEGARVFVGMSPDGPIRSFAPARPPLDVALPDAGGAVTSRQAFFALWRDFLDGLDHGAARECAVEACTPTARWIQQVYDHVNHRPRAA